MLKRLVSRFIQNIKNSSLFKDKKQLARTAITALVTVAVIIAIFVIRSNTSPIKDTNRADSHTPDSPDFIETVVTASPDDFAETTFPSPTPTQEPPAITPPADEGDPASSSDISFESAPPSTDTDIN